MIKDHIYGKLGLWVDDLLRDQNLPTNLTIYDPTPEMENLCLFVPEEYTIYCWSWNSLKEKKIDQYTQKNTPDWVPISLRQTPELKEIIGGNYNCQDMFSFKDDLRSYLVRKNVIKSHKELILLDSADQVDLVDSAPYFKYEENYLDILQYWAISEDLYNIFKQKVVPIYKVTFQDKLYHVWGRTTANQSYLDDEIIQEVADQFS